MAAEFGINVPHESVQLDWQQVLARKRAILQRRSEGAIHKVGQFNDLHLIFGHAELRGPRKAYIKPFEGEDVEITFGKCILATGSTPNALPVPGGDLPQVYSSDSILDIDSIPERRPEAYANGVNLYIKNAEGNYPVEFYFLGYQPEKWKPVNSIEIMRMMGWELNISWWVDVSFTELVHKLGEKKVQEILPEYPENAPTIIPSELKKYPKITDKFIQTDKLFRKFMGWSGTHIGSNNWIVDGKKSVSGKPIIANDTHLGFSAPGTWYTAVVNGGNWKTSGFTLPGTPAIVIGKNPDISWAMTNVMNDDADFYLEKLDSSKTKYFYNGTWKQLQVIIDTIFVKNGKPVKYKIYSTNHGPIVSGIHPYSFIYSGQQYADDLATIQ